jgi:transposase
VVRMGSDERTRRYVSRRTAEGKSKWEIMRCLKRYIAREVYRVLLSSEAAESPPGVITEPALGAEIA